MNLAFDHPAALWGLVAAVLPLQRPLLALQEYPWLPQLPADGWSQAVDVGLRLAGAVAIAGLTLGVAGLHREAMEVERLGRGAHLVLLLDRSRSMDDSFAGRTPAGGEVSKSAAAQRLLTEFVSHRSHDLIGVAAFSSAPLFMLPLTDNRDATLAGVAVLGMPGLAQTHVAKGLALALSYFDGVAGGAARVILLVSDGAAAIDPDSEAKLRRWFAEKGVRLYWIFLRTAGSHGLFEPSPSAEEDNAQTRPERYLHLFFAGLGIPYRAYEAENPAALSEAIADIDRLESKPLAYREKIPRRDLQPACYLTALLALAALGVGQWAEARR
ncbi:MAG: VWA domain-containing protein [Methylococcaceae bacterium]|nr:VWA domain-containing protein [Methylococcaceae bacterium]